MLFSLDRVARTDSIRCCVRIRLSLFAVRSLSPKYNSFYLLLDGNFWNLFRILDVSRTDRPTS